MVVGTVVLQGLAKPGNCYELMAAAAQTKRPESVNASESLLRGMGARGKCLVPVTPSF